MSVNRSFQADLVVSKRVQIIESFETTILVLNDRSVFLVNGCWLS